MFGRISKGDYFCSHFLKKKMIGRIPKGKNFWSHFQRKICLVAFPLEKMFGRISKGENVWSHFLKKKMFGLISKGEFVWSHFLKENITDFLQKPVRNLQEICKIWTKTNAVWALHASPFDLADPRTFGSFSTFLNCFLCFGILEDDPDFEFYLIVISSSSCIAL